MKTEIDLDKIAHFVGKTLSNDKDEQRQLKKFTLIMLEEADKEYLLEEVIGLAIVEKVKNSARQKSVS